MLSDRLFKYGIGKSILLQSAISSTYFYEFDFKIQSGMGELFSQQNKVNLGELFCVHLMMPTVKIFNFRGFTFRRHPSNIFFSFSNLSPSNRRRAKNGVKFNRHVR